MENKMTNNDKIEALAAAYASEIYLWEDPFEAPSVPDESVLKDFIENRDFVEPDLAAQIMNDLNCRRALDRVKFAKHGAFTSEEMISEGEFHKMLESIPAPATKLVLSESSNKTYIPRKGDIFYTKSKLKVFDNGRNYNIYTFLPQAVILLDNGSKMPWGRVFRCAVVTPAYAGDAVEGQDMTLENGWILHKWLCYPVSFTQIDCTRKVASVDNIDEIAAVVNDYFFSENKMTRYGREERRLMAKADYVPAMADAAAARAEWQSEHCVSFDELKRYESIPFRKAAAGEDEVSRVVIRKGREVSAEHFSATLDGNIKIDAVNCEKLEKEHDLPTWSIDRNVAVPDGMVFVLRDLRNGNSIGFGEIRNDVANLEHLISEAVLLPVTAASQVVLEVYIPW